MIGMAEEQAATGNPPSRSEDGGGKPARRPAPRKPAESRSGTGSGNGSRPSEAGESRSVAGNGTGEHGEVRHHPDRGAAKMSAVKAARAAMSQLEMLTNRDAEGIVGLRKNDDGSWTVTVEVVENRRVPESSDLLAEYEVVLDRDGDLVSYERGSRYERGRPRGD
jgi:hypothetical protein